jgi:hypothetical protein
MTDATTTSDAVWSMLFGKGLPISSRERGFLETAGLLGLMGSLLAKPESARDWQWEDDLTDEVTALKTIIEAFRAKSPLSPGALPEGLGRGTAAAGTVPVPHQGVGTARAADGTLHIRFPVDVRLSAEEWTLALFTQWKDRHGFSVPDALALFLRLGQLGATPDAVLSFATDFGPLWYTSDYRAAPATAETDYRYSEPVEEWLSAARCLATVDKFWRRLASDEALSADELDRLDAELAAAGCTRGPRLSADGGSGHDRVWQRASAITLINAKLRAFGPQAGLRLDDSGKTLLIESRQPMGFLPRLWHEEAVRLTAGRQIPLCSGCCTFYVRHGRATRRGQRNYCPECDTTHRRKRDHERRNPRSRAPSAT